MSLELLEPKRAESESKSEGKSEGERVDLMPRNLVQGILYFKCLDLGLIDVTDYDGIVSLFREVSEIIDKPDDSHSKLIRGEIDAGNYERAAEEIVKLILEKKGLKNFIKVELRDVV